MNQLNNSVKEIILNQEQIDILTEHAINSHPNESCAMLLGTHDDQQWNVKEVFLTNNMEKSETNFTISPEELLHGYELAEKKHLELVGVFHSHPNSSAIPSNTDEKFMKVNPVPWIIHSVINNDIAAFVLDTSVEEISINIMERHFYQ